MDRPATISAWKSSLAAGKWPGLTCDKKSLVRQNRQQRQFPLEHRSRGGHFATISKDVARPPWPVISNGTS